MYMLPNTFTMATSALLEGSATPQKVEIFGQDQQKYQEVLIQQAR